MFLYFKDDGTLHLRSKVRDEGAEESFTKKCEVPDDFDLRGQPQTDEEGLVSYAEKTYDEVMEGRAYSDKRAVDYPSIKDQLDHIYHHGLESWKATITAVKDSYPKPGTD